MLAVAGEREKIALIQTPKLFDVVEYLSTKNDDSFKKQCREAIKSQLGKVVIFPEVPQLPCLLNLPQPEAISG